MLGVLWLGFGSSFISSFFGVSIIVVVVVFSTCFGVSVFLISVCVVFAFDSIDLVFVFSELVFELASATFFESYFSSWTI